MKKKITRKLEVKKTTLRNYKGGTAAVLADHDTPTVNDNCDHLSAAVCLIKTYQHTYCVCNPGDWCGYNHETNCLGPLITAG